MAQGGTPLANPIGKGGSSAGYVRLQRLARVHVSVRARPKAARSTPSACAAQSSWAPRCSARTGSRTLRGALAHLRCGPWPAPSPAQHGFARSTPARAEAPFGAFGGWERRKGGHHDVRVCVCVLERASGAERGVRREGWRREKCMVISVFAYMTLDMCRRSETWNANQHVASECIKQRT